MSGNRGLSPLVCDHLLEDRYLWNKELAQEGIHSAWHNGTISLEVKEHYLTDIPGVPFRDPVGKRQW